MPFSDEGSEVRLAATAINGLRLQHDAFMAVIEPWMAEGDVGHVRHIDGGLEVTCLGETLRARPRWVTHDGRMHATEYALRLVSDPDGPPVWTIYLRGDLLCTTPSQAAVLVTMRHPMAQKTMLYAIGNALLASGRYLPVAPT